MYIEVVHDQAGEIKLCYCVDTLPTDASKPYVIFKDGVPSGYEQSRINIDTLIAMEIDAASGQKAVLNAQGQAEMVTVERSQYICNTFKVDVSGEIIPPAGVQLPPGMKMRTLLRK